MPPTFDTSFHLAAVAAALAPHADRGRADAMRAYMRGHFDFLGIPTPQRRAVLKPVFVPLRDAAPGELLALADALWVQPQREYQYAALDLLAARWKTLQDTELPWLIALARQKSWWDTVDGVAAIVGDVLRGTHEGMDQALADSNFWVRRIALLHQLGWRDAVDAPRLFRYALALSHEKEFFIQKAIGWALRDYAHHAPQQVREFLNEQRSRLAPLSYREAAKHL